MKIFQFQNDENTKFVYQNQNKTEKHSTFVEAEKLRDEAKNMFREQLGKLNQEIFNGSAEAFKQMEAGEVLGASEEKHNQLLQGEELLLSTGWTVRLGGSYVEDGNGNSVFAQNGDIYMERITPEDKANNLPKVKETLTRKSSNGKIVYRRREYLKGKDKRTVAKTYTSEDAGNIKKIKNNEVKVKYDKTEGNNPDKVKDKVDHSKIKFDDFAPLTALH
jgi:hypothetical protein